MLAKGGGKCTQRFAGPAVGQGRKHDDFAGGQRRQAKTLANLDCPWRRKTAGKGEIASPAETAAVTIDDVPPRNTSVQAIAAASRAWVAMLRTPQAGESAASLRGSP